MSEKERKKEDCTIIVKCQDKAFQIISNFKNKKEIKQMQKGQYYNFYSVLLL